MAETFSDYYRNLYLQTHMQRFNQSLQMAQQSQMQNFALAQMLADQLKSYDKQIADIQGAKTTDQLDRLTKVYNLQTSVRDKATKNQLTIVENINKKWNIDTALPTINNAADKFGSSLASGGNVTDKVRRHAGSVGGYTRGTESAKAAAATTYQEFKSEASRKGFATTFSASDTQIRQAIADKFGVSTTDIDTVDVQREKMLKDELKKRGGQAVSNKELEELEALARGDATPGQKTAILEDLSIKRAQLAEKQMEAIDRSQMTPDEILMQARNIYNTNFAGRKTQDRTRGAQQFSAYFDRLDPVQQNIMIGYNQTKPKDVKFMQQKRSNIVGDMKKEVAYDLYYALEKDRKAGKPPAYKLHEKIEQYFPDDQKAQQEVLGYIFRFTEMEQGINTDKVRERQDALGDMLIEGYGRSAPTDEELFDLIAQERFLDVDLGQSPPAEIPSEADVEFDESGGTVNLEAVETDKVDEPAKQEEPKPPQPPPFEVKQAQLPSWATEGSVTIIAPGTYKVESTKYGNFTVGEGGQIIEGAIKQGKGTPDGWYEELEKTNK